LGHGAVTIEARTLVFNFRYRSAAHFVEVFRHWYGPVQKAFLALPEAQASRLEGELIELLEARRRRDATTLIVPSEYLEAVVTRR
jgi:hypothetical protein